MDLLALAIVNVVTACAMYVLFSIRFSRAVRQTVEQTQKKGLMRELKENVELTIEYINSSLDTMDQKTRSFYQLLRRSEELVRQLESMQADLRASESEAAAAGSRARKGRSASPKKTVDKPALPNAANTTRSPSQPAASPGEAGRTRAPGQPADDLLSGRSRSGAALEFARAEDSAGAYNVDRVLKEMGDDRLQISAPAPSAETAYRTGERSRPVATYAAAPTPAAGTGVLGRIGAIARRVLGVDSMPDLTAGAAASTTAASAGASPGTTSARPAARFEIPQLTPEELEQAVPGTPRRAPRSASEAVPAVEPAILPRLDRLDLGSQSVDAWGEVPNDAVRRTNAGRSPGAGYGPLFSAGPQLPPPSEILASEGLTNGAHEGEARRADVIRTLLRYGYRPSDISRATGIALPEVELVASLPPSTRRPRRQRLTATDRPDQD